MKKLTTAALLLALALTGFAADRTDSELRQIALSQLAKGGTRLNVRGARAMGSVDLERTVTDGKVAVYAAEGAGSVLLSTDDRFRAVLGYTTEVIKGDGEMPCGMKWWMAEMNRQMQSTGKAEAATDGAVAEQVASEGYSVVGQLVTTKWGQGSPYNAYAPKFDGENAPSGCVATALAQILNYNEWPKSAKFTGQYSIDGGNTYVDEEVSTTYRYPYKTAYGAYSVDGGTTNVESITYTIVDRKHIGWLLRDCGYASYMMYGADASGALIMDAALGAVDYFSYPATATRYAYRNYYSDEEWHNIVYSELEKGSPILYGGQDEEVGGHAFVVHGVDADGLVAVNWGWQGLCDGYFAMDAMDSGDGTFQYGQEMIYGLRHTPLADDNGASQWAGSYTIANGSGTDKVTLQSGGLYNYTLADFTGTVALCFEDYDGGKTSGISILTPEDGAVSPFYGFSLQQTGLDEYIPSVTEKGHTYKVYMASCTEEEDAAGIMQMARVSGGRKYYVMTVDDYGTPSITGSDFDTTSAISRVDAEGEKTKTGKMYNLSGQQVGGSYKGIVIKDGKKQYSN